MLTILSGPVLFGEPLPHRPLALVARVVAFLLVVAATALTPPPVEAPPPRTA
jgi:hypothetical protein